MKKVLTSFPKDLQKTISIGRRLISVIIIFIALSNLLYANVVDSSLIIGNFRISKVIDADTFRFENLDKSTRLLGIDTEETFKTSDAEQKINEVSAFWEEFYKSERGDSKMPVKTDSPLGYEAWQWAEEFFNDVDYVRLEKEDDNRTIDIFGRYLVYVIAILKDGKEINYNIECVRKGYSPYYNKYGNSKRFHQQFLDAQSYALQNKLGVWNPEKKHYPDYDERLLWWEKRAQQLENFDKKYANIANYFNLSNDDDYNRLSYNVGEEIIVFGGISDILTNKLPYLIRIPHTKNENFDVVVYEENVDMLKELDIETKKEYYVYIKGKLEVYNGTYQIVLRNKDQIWME